MGRSSRANISLPCSSAGITLRRKLKISLIDEQDMYAGENYIIDQFANKSMDNVISNSAVYITYMITTPKAIQVVLSSTLSRLLLNQPVQPSQ